MVREKPALYIVFDQLPHKKDGGLVATYINFVQQFKSELDIKLISVFNNGGNDIDAFDCVDIINLSAYVLDNRFFRAFSHLKNGEIRRFLHALASSICFFSFIPIARHKMRRLPKGSMVIAVSPAAAIFVSNKIKFILEIHTKFEYFWGNSIIGKLQASFAAKPVLTVFRNKTDATKGAARFPSDFIYNGVANPPLRKACDQGDRRPFSALYVGGLVEHKNPLMLIDCAERMRGIFPDFTLDIYGIGELETTLQQEIERRDLTGTVTLKGFVDNKSVYACYQQFWFTSTLEGFGLVLVEAMANKTPVITTNWGDAVAEIVDDGKTGFIVNSEEEFCARSTDLFRDAELQYRISEKAYEEFLTRFSLEQNKAAWKRIFSKVYPDS